MHFWATETFVRNVSKLNWSNREIWQETDTLILSKQKKATKIFYKYNLQNNAWSVTIFILASLTLFLLNSKDNKVQVKDLKNSWIIRPWVAAIKFLCKVLNIFSYFLTSGSRLFIAIIDYVAAMLDGKKVKHFWHLYIYIFFSSRKIIFFSWHPTWLPCKPLCWRSTTCGLVWWLVITKSNDTFNSSLKEGGG